MSNTKKRKKRIIHNALVDDTSVSEQPGTNYSNWIKISKQKMKVRYLLLDY